MSAADRAAHAAATYVRRSDAPVRRTAATPLTDEEREELSKKLAERNKNSSRR
ncbi:hypothetical protein ABT154_21455 [Streptomyces sp. NPDC001728]|uniref:hypothetical protein n=1 Tax=Streptomyces sp. NPDC001728 TaxID=3154396 RepID=UPI00332FDD89